MESPSSLNLLSPGVPSALPSYILEELRNLHPKYRKYLSFFGGHPVSITNQSFKQIFSELQTKQDGTKQSPYLVCEKTDGVRYILIICFVKEKDRVVPLNGPSDKQSKQGVESGHEQNSIDNGEHENDASFEQQHIQCYLVSREGQKNLVSYAVDINISDKWARKTHGKFQHIVEILDGELILDSRTVNHTTKKQYKYLIFDLLVHLGQNLTDQPLLLRLKEIRKFLIANEALLRSTTGNTQSQNKNKKAIITVELKDFFRLTCYKYNSTMYLLNKYIKCLPHENDGLIFNHHSKPYEFGLNNGYIKWKPAHLNTLDFMVVPNQNLEQRFGRRVLDLYLADRDQEVQEKYSRCFYAFTIVSEQEYNEIQKQYQENLNRAFEEQENQIEEGQNAATSGAASHFTGAVIAECKYESTKADEKQIFRSLLDHHRSPEEIREEIMKPFDSNQNKETERILGLQKIVYEKCWKIYKVREDKNLPNNLRVAQKIEQSIKDDIQEEKMIAKNEELNKLSNPQSNFR